MQENFLSVLISFNASLLGWDPLRAEMPVAIQQWESGRIDQKQFKNQLGLTSFLPAIWLTVVRYKAGSIDLPVNVSHIRLGTE